MRFYLLDDDDAKRLGATPVVGKTEGPPKATPKAKPRAENREVVAFSESGPTHPCIVCGSPDQVCTVPTQPQVHQTTSRYRFRPVGC